ncbi:hypothetical protein [Aliikangiella maris]|uniref:Uncharacterized protein n=2 Tax=Aliikangiella maris TaxID=3162458 RepID=A0ABV2BY25_9GAMM
MLTKKVQPKKHPSMSNQPSQMPQSFHLKIFDNVTPQIKPLPVNT